MLATTMPAACTSWKAQHVSPEQLITREHPSAVRVQRQDGSQVVVNRPRIGTDSLLGVTARRQPTSVPLADISQVAVQRFNALKTVGLVLGIWAGIVGLIRINCSQVECFG
jgi:hypothetical protein